MAAQMGTHNGGNAGFPFGCPLKWHHWIRVQQLELGQRWTKSCTTSRQRDTIACWYLQQNYDSRVSWVVQNGLRPSTVCLGLNSDQVMGTLPKRQHPSICVPPPRKKMFFWLQTKGHPPKTHTPIRGCLKIGTPKQEANIPTMSLEKGNLWGCPPTQSLRESKNSSCHVPPNEFPQDRPPRVPSNKRQGEPPPTSGKVSLSCPFKS